MGNTHLSVTPVRTERVDRLSEVLQQFINELERGLAAPTDMSTSHESTTPKASKAVGVSNAC